MKRKIKVEIVIDAPEDKVTAVEGIFKEIEGMLQQMVSTHPEVNTISLETTSESED